eukprot:scaffold24741_cov53-Attheya_sp.AAC.2
MDQQQHQQQDTSSSPQAIEAEVNHRTHNDATNNNNDLIVRGIRYVIPYVHEQRYSVRLEDADRQASVLQVLASRLGRPYLPLSDVESYFTRAIVDEGRVDIRRHCTYTTTTTNKRQRHQDSDSDSDKKNTLISNSNDFFERVVDPHMMTARNDILRIRNHVHERCTIYRGPLVTIMDLPGNTNTRTTSHSHSIIPDNNDDKQCHYEYRAVYKPAGLPVINNEGHAYGCVAGLVRHLGYHLGHRLDLPVEGVLLLGKGKKRAGRLIRALSPQAKQQQQSSNGNGGGVLKAYLALVQGDAWFQNQKEEDNSQEDTNSMSLPMQEVRRWLTWDNRAKKATVVTYDPADKDRTSGDDDTRSKKDHDQKGGGAKETITRIQQLTWNESKGESLVRVELVTGARHQVRAVLASLGLPIKGDVTYGGDGNEDDGVVRGEYIGTDGKAITKDSSSTSSKSTTKVVTSLSPQSTNTTAAAASTKKEPGLLVYADDDQGRLFKMLSDHKVDGCDKCRWQLAETQQGGTTRGAAQLEDAICLLSYHYRIPSLGIDVRLPDHMLPAWAKQPIT